MSKLIVVVGPTASGKSSLAVRLAKHLGGEIISADSRQVYKSLNIGTGKVTKREMRGIPHHLIDVVSPQKVFTASDFVRLAARARSNILRDDKIVIVAGGTGFYIDALLGRINLADVPVDRTLRSKLQHKNPFDLFKILRKHDPARAARMNSSDMKNSVRLVRAIEIAAKNSSHRGQHWNSRSDLDILAIPTLWIGIQPDRDVLRKNIRTRLLARMKNGMVREARKLHERGLSWKRMEDLGLEYRYLARYLQKKISKEEMLVQLEAKIWQYAKRQMTYWRRNAEIQWFSSGPKAEAWLRKLF